MRLLHTSDWHLGQTFHGYDRQHEHSQFLHWLLDTLEQTQADALLIAGDIFDNANPPATALHLFYRFLRDAKTRLPALQVIVVAGNHDSPFRLEAPSPLLTALDVTVVGQVSRLASGEIDLDRLVVPLRDRSGSVRSWCLAVPFLRGSDLPPLRERDESVTDGYSQAVTALYRQVQAHAESRRDADQAIIALGHCHLHGGQVSQDSERRIVIGGSEALPSSLFDPALAYVALGHLHRAQRVGEDDTRRYCGSPLPLSFSEADYHHQVVSIDLERDQVSTVEVLPIPRTVELIRAPEQSLGESLAWLTALERPACATEQQPWLEVRVRLDQPEPGLRHQVETALKGKPVRLVRIEPRYPGRAIGRPDGALAPTLDDIGRLEPRDVFINLHRQRHATEPDAALQAAFDSVCRLAEESALSTTLP